MTDAALAQLILAEQAERDLASEFENLFWNGWDEGMTYEDDDRYEDDEDYFEAVRRNGELLFNGGLGNWRNTWIDPHFDGIAF